MITQDDIIYFIITDRFLNGDHGNDLNIDESDPLKYHGGDFRGITDKIPYLKELGITALWITPVYLSIGRINDNSDGYHGYWALDFRKVDPHLYSAKPGFAEGSKEYLRELCRTLHDNEIKLILDMVVNHTGYHNDTYREYPDKEIPDEWFNKHGHGETEEELYGLPDLDHDNPDVRDYFVNNILDWIEETGIDAIRMDTVKHIEKAFWYFFKSYVRGKYRDITLIGEVLDEYNPSKISEYQTMHDFDTLFNFPLYTKIKETFIHGGSMTALARSRFSDNENQGALDIDTKLYTNANRLITLLDNHDLKCRIKTEILNRWGHWDRMRANRILKLCLSFLFTTRGIPQIYYGTEIGLEGDSDPHNRRDMRWEIFEDSFQPDPSDTEYRDAKEIFEHTKKLIKIRKENEAIPFGYLFTLYSDYFMYSYMREFRGNTVIVVINNGLERTQYPLSINIGGNSNIPSRIKRNLEGRTLQNQLDPGDRITYENGHIQIQLEGKDAKIYKLV